MNITNFAKKLAEKPVFKTRIKSDQVKLPEIAIGYFLAPFCAMFANAIFGAYLNRYYVDVLGWTKFGAFATLLPIVSVIFVVLGNLMIGQWIDNTRSTQGKARPYMIIAAPMLIIAIILMFMTPAKGNNAVQMIWIAVSYNLYYALAYPCFYCAHSSMVSLSTRNSESRGLLATLSNAAMVASAGVGASIVVPILLQSFLFVTKEGGIDVDASYSHWRIISIVLCLVSAFGCMLEYYFTRERITEETINLNVKEEKMPLKKQLEGCIHNKYWWIIILYFLIYRMAIEGKGPYEIARILATEKIERPSYYLAQRGMGNHQSNYNAADPYTWRGGTVADILSKQEYMGHTVNFRTYKESYKDKRVKMTPKEDLVIFENTQEAIIDKETWERVQTLRKTIRRTDSIGKANPLTGLMFCADCGAKMYNHRGKAGNARDWAGRPNGKKRPDRDEYNCSRYDLGNQHYDKYCTTHLIRTAVVNELLLEAIKGVCDYALNNEAEFMAQVCSASEDRQEKAARSIRQRKQRNEKRTDELTRLIRKLYEDNVSGRLSDTLFEQMLRDFEAELSDLTEIVSQDQQELERISRETINAEKFLSLVRKYTDFSELTPAMINEFVEKILVHQAQGKGASRIQEIEIFFNFVGKVDIPHKEVELTEEEKAALAEQERRRAKKAEYNRRYMEKKRRQWKEQQEQEQAEQLPLAAEQKGEHIA